MLETLFRRKESPCQYDVSNRALTAGIHYWKNREVDYAFLDGFLTVLTSVTYQLCYSGFTPIGMSSGSGPTSF